MIKKAESFEKWYEVIQQAEFATTVDDFTVLMPTGLETWHLAMDRLNELLLEAGYQNWCFPLTAGKGDLLPATDIVLKAIKARIRSAADMPLRINNYINLQLRRRAGLLLLADKETIADECWAVFSSQKEAEDEVKVLLSVYRELISGTLNLDYLELSRPWLGNGWTVGLDAQLPNGRIVNLGVVSYLGQSVAKSAGIKVDGNYPYMVRANLAARLLGALAAIHGDNRGLILPPAIAPLQVVIVPIAMGPAKIKIFEKAGELLGRLASAGYRAHLDDREIPTEIKVHEWELKGVPIRIEIGPKELETRQIAFVRRDFLERIVIEEAKLESQLIELSDSIAFQLRKRGLEAVLIQDSTDLVDAKKKALVGWVRLPLCMSLACGRALEHAGLVCRGTLFGKLKALKKACVVCGKPAKASLYVGRPI